MKDLILLVEDDELFGQSLKDFLEINGFPVKWAKDGNTAISFFHALTPRLILLDVQLPGKDGFEVAAEIRKSNGIVPLIFMTGTALKEMHYNKAFQSLRALNYIEKPFAPQKVLAQIRGLLQPDDIINYEKNGYRITIHGQLLVINNMEYPLSVSEIQLFTLLLENINSPVSRKDVLIKVLGDDRYELNTNLNNAMKNIRKVLNDFPGIKIKTFYGNGFKLFFEENR